MKMSIDPKLRAAIDRCLQEINDHGTPSAPDSYWESINALQIMIDDAHDDPEAILDQSTSDTVGN